MPVNNEIHDKEIDGIVLPVDVRKVGDFLWRDYDWQRNIIKLAQMSRDTKDTIKVQVSAALNVGGVPYFTSDNGFRLSFQNIEILEMYLVVHKHFLYLVGSLEDNLFYGQVDAENPQSPIRVSKLEDASLLKSLRKSAPIVETKLLSIRGYRNGRDNHAEKAGYANNILDTCEKFGLNRNITMVDASNNSIVRHKVKDNPLYAGGNVYIYDLKRDKDGNIKFTYAFYGTASGNSVSFDDAPRGSLVPQYKNRAVGFGFELPDGSSRLTFQFAYKGTNYVANCTFEAGKKITQATRAYWVEFNTHNENELEEAEIQEDIEPIEDSPEMETLLRKPKKNKGAGSFEEATEQIERELKAEKGQGKTHIKKRPAPMSKEEQEKYSLDPKSFIEVIVNNVAAFAKENKCRKLIKKSEDDKPHYASYEVISRETRESEFYRIVARGGVVKLQWFNDEGEWELLKSYAPEKKRVAAKRFLRMVKETVFGAEEEE